MATSSTPQNMTAPQKRSCPFCGSDRSREGKQKNAHIDYKDYPLLKKFTDYFGNIKKRYYTGVCLFHQKQLREAVERARFMGLLAYRK
jgi:small subunit ribosomal protein S18